MSTQLWRLGVGKREVYNKCNAGVRTQRRARCGNKKEAQGRNSKRRGELVMALGMKLVSSVGVNQALKQEAAKRKRL
jgi:hypothetical protein